MAPPVAVMPVPENTKIKDSDILELFRKAKLSNGELTFMGRTRPLDEEKLARVKAAVDMFDDDSIASSGKWTQIEWTDVQQS